MFKVNVEGNQGHDSRADLDFKSISIAYKIVKLWTQSELVRTIVENIWILECFLDLYVLNDQGKSWFYQFCCALDKAQLVKLNGID